MHAEEAVWPVHAPPCGGQSSQQIQYKMRIRTTPTRSCSRRVRPELMMRVALFLFQRGKARLDSVMGKKNAL